MSPGTFRRSAVTQTHAELEEALSITESELIVPALLVLAKSSSELSTTDLSQALREILRPSEEDLDILSGRSDDKFSQKVRNLRSHKTLESRGLAVYQSRGRQGYWQITETGRAFIDAKQEAIEAILQPGFEASIVRRAFARLETGRPDLQTRAFDESIPVREGGSDVQRLEIYERSRRLRDYAIQQKIKEDNLKCEACGFNFEEVYGDLGRGFIEVHHKVPIFCHRGQSVESRITEAIKDVAMLCANCHRMIHRSRDTIMSVSQLRSLLGKRGKIAHGSA